MSPDYPRVTSRGAHEMRVEIINTKKKMKRLQRLPVKSYGHSKEGKITYDPVSVTFVESLAVPTPSLTLSSDVFNYRICHHMEKW